MILLFVATLLRGATGIDPLLFDVPCFPCFPGSLEPKRREAGILSFAVGSDLASWSVTMSSLALVVSNCKRPDSKLGGLLDDFGSMPGSVILSKAGLRSLEPELEFTWTGDGPSRSFRDRVGVISYLPILGEA